MSKKKNKKEDINDFDDLKDLLLKNLSPQNNEGINDADDLDNLDDDSLLSEDNNEGMQTTNSKEEEIKSVESDWEYEQNKYIGNQNSSQTTKKKAKKQEEVNDFDDLKDLLLKNLNPQLLEEDIEEVNGELDLQEDNSFKENESNDSPSKSENIEIDNESGTEQTIYSKKNNPQKKGSNKEIKQDEINDFDDLKDLLLKNLSQHKPENSRDAQDEDPFMKDAMEGLEMIQDKSKIDNSVLSMNNNLNKLLDSRKQRKKKHTLPSNQWALLAVGLVLLLAILGYFVIHLNGMAK